ncbi:MAG: peptidyl-prolyl cis-trans isomerase [Candidatus Latescibacterota bacterium]
MRWTAWLGALVLAGVSCSRDGAPGSEPGVVARVDRLRISAAELQAFVRNMPPALRSREQGQAARREYLHSLMARHVLALEARRRGLDTLAQVASRVEDRWRQHLVNAYRTEYLGPLVQVTLEEVQRFFAAHELARQRELAAIVVASKEAAREVQRRLGAGARFEDLAAGMSLHRQSGQGGGRVGYVSAGEARRLHIPEEVFRNLPAGTVSEPLPVGNQWQLVRFGRARTGTVEAFREQIERTLRAGKRAAAEAEQIGTLAAELGWRPEPEGLRMLLQAASTHRYLRRGDLDPQAAAHALFVYKGGQVTLGEYVHALWSEPLEALKGRGLADSATVARTAAELVLGQEMLVAASVRAGLDQRPQEQAWLGQATEEFAIRELRRQEAVEPAGVDEDDVEDFYEDHTDAFRRPVKVYAVEVLVKTEAEGQQVRSAVDAGRPLEELAAETSVRAGTGPQPGVLVADDHLRLAHPRLYRTLSSAPLDVVVGPVAVEDGYSVFRVIHREGGEVAPFPAVAPQARALARQEKKQRLLRELVVDLFAALGDRVVVYEDELAAALPDSLLADARQSGGAVPATPAGGL